MRRSRSAAVALSALAGLVLPAVLFAQEHAAEAEGGNPIFSVNLGLAVWTLILFGLTLLILSRTAFPAIARTLEERNRKIQEAIDEARKGREEMQALVAEQRSALDAARREAQELIEKGRSAADGVKREMLAEAKEQQAQILADAQREIAAEREKLKEDVRREAATVALAAAERLLRKEVDSEENRRLVDQFVSEIS